MRETKGGRNHHVGTRRVELPKGVSLADWGLERVKVQNPSIRSYLGCIRQIEEVLDSNYAILNCSPEHLLKIWHRVQEVRQLLRSELVPTLTQPSVIPGLGEARRHAEAAYQKLAGTTLRPMEDYGATLRPDQYPAARKLLCVALGKIYAFLRDTFGEIVASDPRSRHDADYFLSKRFAQDIHESEWLYSSVYELTDLVDGLERACSAEFADLQSKMSQERKIPSEEEWDDTARLLESVLDDLIGKLKGILGLRGARVDDMEVLEAHSAEISRRCRTLMDIYSIGREIAESLAGVGGPTLAEQGQKARDLATCHRVVCARVVEQMGGLIWSLRALAKDAVHTKAGIERRRALMLAKDLTEFRVGDHRPVDGI